MTYPAILSDIINNDTCLYNLDQTQDDLTLYYTVVQRQMSL